MTTGSSVDRELYTRVMRTIHEVFPDRMVTVREERDYLTGVPVTWFEIQGDVSDDQDWEKVVTVCAELESAWKRLDAEHAHVILRHPNAI